jgi:PleD family two-component response regulator
VVLIAAPHDNELADVLERLRYVVVRGTTGSLLREWALDVRPDLILLGSHLADMSGIEASRLLRQDFRIGHNIPTLVLTAEPPTPEQRVAALGAGVWDFLRYPGETAELALQLETYVRAKRNLDMALAEGVMDPNTGLHSRTGLARRARELGALMARSHGSLSCIVFSCDAPGGSARLPQLAAHSARESDVVGALNQKAFAILAPGTDQAGAVQLARRISGALLNWLGTGSGSSSTGTSPLRAGYESVGNLKYSPLDPVELLTRAIAAVRDGTPEPGYPWLHRYSVSAGMRESEPRHSPVPGTINA